jgi:xylulokinase
MSLIGLDVGTTGCKAIVFNPEGKILGYGFQEYDIISDNTGKAEHDPNLVWEITKKVLKSAIHESKASDIKALSLSVHGDAIVPIDKDFNPLFGIILGMDYRSQPQARMSAEEMGDRELFNLTGMRPHPINSLVKALWLRETQPAIFKKAWKIVTVADFILGKLGAGAVIDATMASRTMATDVTTGKWSKKVLEAFQFDEGLFSEIVPSGTVVGEMRNDLAKELGLPSNVKLVTGGHDQVCAALGAGIISQGTAIVSTGTAEVLSTAFNAVALTDNMYNSYYPCYRYTKDGMFFTFALNHVGGLLFRWYRDTFCNEEIQHAASLNEDAYAKILEQAPEDPTKLFVLPHFNGSGTPWCDMDSKGAIVGLTMSTNKFDIAKAILESQTYELKINKEILAKSGVPISELRAVGGGAKSPVWLQLKADILNCPVHTLKIREAACLGAAILAGSATGVYASIDEGVKATVKTDKTYLPQEKNTKAYQDRFEIYKEIYPALKPINDKISEKL